MKSVGELRERYPHIQFRRHWDLSSKTYYELGQCQALTVAICEMPLRPEYHKRLLGVSLIKGAQATTAIEGNTLTQAEVERVAEGKPLPPSKAYQEREVRNILDAMNQIRNEVVDGDAVQLLTAELILGFHKLVGRELGEHFDAIPGRFRQDERIVGPYRCPRHEDVPALVDQLCDWLRLEFRFDTGNQSFDESVVQAIVTHVYLEWIHPFGDGNGRTGRLLEFYILLRAGNPDIASHVLSNFYNLTRPEYYRQLEKAHRDQDLTSFVAYAVQGYRDGLLESLATIQANQLEIAWRSLIHDRFAEQRYRKKTVFKRRRDLMLALPMDRGLRLAEITSVSPQIARDYAGLSERTVARDLEFLKQIELVAETDGRFSANIAILRQQMAIKRKQVAASAAVEAAR